MHLFRDRVSVTDSRRRILRGIILSSLRGLARLIPNSRPSVKTLGYCRSIHARKKNREENKFSSRVEGWILAAKDFRGRDQAWGLNASFS